MCSCLKLKPILCSSGNCISAFVQSHIGIHLDGACGLDGVKDKLVSNWRGDS